MTGGGARREEDENELCVKRGEESKVVPRLRNAPRGARALAVYLGTAKPSEAGGAHASPHEGRELE